MVDLTQVTSWGTQTVSDADKEAVVRGTTGPSPVSWTEPPHGSGPLDCAEVYQSRPESWHLMEKQLIVEPNLRC